MSRFEVGDEVTRKKNGNIVGEVVRVGVSDNCEVKWPNFPTARFHRDHELRLKIEKPKLATGGVVGGAQAGVIPAILDGGYVVSKIDVLKYYFAKAQGDPAKIANDPVNHPTHYTSGPKCECGKTIECIQITRERNFDIGNAIKYLWRAGLKPDADRSQKDKQIEDLEKAIFYIRDEIKSLQA